MSDNKKYYYLKLKDNFFDSEEIIILQNMQDGYLYSDILFKMYLRSLKNEGLLMFNNFIPYDANILSQIVRHSVGVVEKAIKLFQQLSLIEIMDNGAIYMLNIQNYIGNSSTEADRQREYQNRIKSASIIPCKKSNKKTYIKPTPEIEKEIELKKEIDIETEKEHRKRFIPPSLQEVEEYINLKNFNVNPINFFNFFHESNWIDSKGNKVKNWKQKIITWDSHSDKNKSSFKKTNMQEALELEERLKSYES